MNTGEIKHTVFLVFWGLLEADCSQNQEKYTRPENFSERQDLKGEMKTLSVLSKNSIWEQVTKIHMSFKKKN